jgi:hypothetical protein
MWKVHQHFHLQKAEEVIFHLHTFMWGHLRVEEKVEEKVEETVEEKV